MHTNHRRKNKHRASHHNCQSWKHRLSLGEYLTIYWRKFRADQRICLAEGRYDDLRSRTPNSVAWDAY